MEHDGCKGCKHESESEDSKYCSKCTQNATDKYEPMTNADRIRNMTDEELAVCLALCPVTSGEGDCIHSRDDVHCFDCILEWLQSEVKDGD